MHRAQTESYVEKGPTLFCVPSMIVYKAKQLLVGIPPFKDWRSS